MTDTERLRYIRERCEAATPEEWTICPDDIPEGLVGRIAYNVFRIRDWKIIGKISMSGPRARFLVRAREDVPWLLERVEWALRPMARPNAQTCKKCGRQDGMNFHISDEVWERVSEGRWNVLCPWCFDQLAVEKGISYEFEDLSFAGRAGTNADYLDRVRRAEAALERIDRLRWCYTTSRTP